MRHWDKWSLALSKPLCPLSHTKKKRDDFAAPHTLHLVGAAAHDTHNLMECFPETLCEG